MNWAPLSCRQAIVSSVFALLGVLMLLGAQAQPSAPFEDSVTQRARACTGCHGDQGRSAPSGYVPRLAGKPAAYLFFQMQAFRDGRRPHVGMARLLENVDDPLLRELAAHFAGLKLPYPPPASPPPVPAMADRARRMVRDGLPQAGVAACAACHGEALMGNGTLVPGLLGLPRDYLVGQLGAWRQGMRHARSPDCMAEVARRLPAADIPVLADWLAAQAVPGDSMPSPAARTAERKLHGLRCADDSPAKMMAETAAPIPVQAEPVARGAYLARVGNCAGCHQRRGSQDLSGGDPLVTPFGTVYAGNLTPDAATGLGLWTAGDFWHALHEGRGKNGRRLVPVFPYSSYTQVSRADSDALFAYFKSLAPVVRRRPDHALRFPYGTPLALAAWQVLYFKPGQQVSKVPKDPVLARGRYLVEGLGHCLECHAARGRWGQRGDDPSGALMPLRDWWAPSLHPRPGQRVDEVVAMLRDGRDQHGSAMGPMGQIVRQSTRDWRDDDLQAAARYLMSLPPAPSSALQSERSAAATAAMALGRQIYNEQCANCHGRNGEGVFVGGRQAIVPLAGNPSVTQPQVHNLLQVLKHGAFGTATSAHPRPFGMPPPALNLAEQAAVISFLRQSWGHHASTVSELDLLVLR
jgi:cytochrome c553